LDTQHAAQKLSSRAAAASWRGNACANKDHAENAAAHVPDAIALAQKRKRGRPKKPAADLQVHKRQRTSVSMYAELSESDEGPPFAGPSQPDPPLGVLALLRCLGIDTRQASHLPSSRNIIPVSSSSPSHLSKCDKVIEMVVKVAASIIYPADADKYAARFHPRLYAGVLRVAEALRRTPRGSLEQRTLRALLCGSLYLHDARLAAADFPESDQEESDEPDDLDDDGDSQNMSDIGGVRAKFQQGNDDAVDADAATGTTMAREMSQRTYARSRLDWTHILHDVRLVISKMFRDRVDTVRIDVALRFIYSRQNSQLLSWGTRTIPTQTGPVELPAVTRRKTMEQISRDYFSSMAARSDTGRPLGRTTFLDILSSVTARDSSRKSAVDYVVGTLVNDHKELVRRVILVAAPVSERERLNLLVDKAELVVKHQFFDNHIASISDD
jgi:hypothetical protein